MKKFLSELAPIELAAEIAAFICLVIYIVLLVKGKGQEMLFVLGIILILNGVGCIKRNPSNFKTSAAFGLIIILINLFLLFR